MSVAGEHCFFGAVAEEDTENIISGNYKSCIRRQIVIKKKDISGIKDTRPAALQYEEKSISSLIDRWNLPLSVGMKKSRNLCFDDERKRACRLKLINLIRVYFFVAGENIGDKSAVSNHNQLESTGWLSHNQRCSPCLHVCRVEEAIFFG